MSPAWDKEKICESQTRFEPDDLQNTGRALYPLELWSSRVPAWFESFQTLRFFLCPMFATWRLINFHICFTELKWTQFTPSPPPLCSYIFLQKWHTQLFCSHEQSDLHFHLSSFTRVAYPTKQLWQNQKAVKLQMGLF